MVTAPKAEWFGSVWFGFRPIEVRIQRKRMLYLCLDYSAFIKYNLNCFQRRSHNIVDKRALLPLSFSVPRVCPHRRQMKVYGHFVMEIEATAVSRAGPWGRVHTHIIEYRIYNIKYTCQSIGLFTVYWHKQPYKAEWKGWNKKTNNKYLRHFFSAKIKIIMVGPLCGTCVSISVSLSIFRFNPSISKNLNHRPKQFMTFALINDPNMNEILLNYVQYTYALH